MTSPILLSSIEEQLRILSSMLSFDPSPALMRAQRLVSSGLPETADGLMFFVTPDFGGLYSVVGFFSDRSESHVLGLVRRRYPDFEYIIDNYTCRREFHTLIVPERTVKALERLRVEGSLLSVAPVRLRSESLQPDSSWYPITTSMMLGLLVTNPSWVGENRHVCALGDEVVKMSLVEYSVHPSYKGYYRRHYFYAGPNAGYFGYAPRGSIVYGIGHCTMEQSGGIRDLFNDGALCPAFFSPE